MNLNQLTTILILCLFILTLPSCLNLPTKKALPKEEITLKVDPLHVDNISKKVEIAKNKQSEINDDIESKAETITGLENENSKLAILKAVELSNIEVIPNLELSEKELEELRKEVIRHNEDLDDLLEDNNEELEELEQEVEQLQDSSFIEIKKKLMYLLMVGTFLMTISITLIITGNPRCIYIGVLGFGLIISASVVLYFLSNIAWIAPVVLTLFVVFCLTGFLYKYHYCAESRLISKALDNVVDNVEILKNKNPEIKQQLKKLEMPKYIKKRIYDVRKR